jgi:hypothetical protein
MTARQFLSLPIVMVLGLATGVTSASTQDLIIDHLDGTATIMNLEEAHPGMVIHKTARYEPSLGSATYLNIAVDMATVRLVDTMEAIYGVADAGFVHELFQIAAGTGRYDGIVASYKYDSYGAFVLESDYMGVYESTFDMEPGCDGALLEDAVKEVWPLVQQDATAQGIDLTSYVGLVWWFPYGPCNTPGFAYIGPMDDLFDHPYRLAFIVFPTPWVLKHEIGHTRGLMHLSCYTVSGEVVEYCESGNMGTPGGFTTVEGYPHPAEEHDLFKTAAHNQYVLGWTSPTAVTATAGLLGESDPQRVASRAAQPKLTFLNVTKSGTYRISAHVGPASENAYPDLLIIPSEEEHKYWFISFEEGDGFNSNLNLHLRIEEQNRNVTVRYQFHYPDALDDSIREALLGIGECVLLDHSVEVCNEALCGSEEADVRIRFPEWRSRRPPGRRLTPSR